MQPKRRLKVFLVLIALGLVSCLLTVWVNRNNVLNGPCVPLDYPGVGRTIDHKVFESDASLETIKDFYNAELDVLFDPNEEADKRWFFENLSEDRILYTCNGVENNRLRMAVGCINVIDYGTTITIETFFFHSEDASCDVVDFDVASP